MPITKITSLLLFVLIFAVLGFSQKKENISKWLRIKALVSNREDVEKIFGKGEFYQNKYFVTYKINDGVVSVGYSLGNCNQVSSILNVPEWTVTDISYDFLKNSPKLKDLIGNKKQFKKRQDGDGINQIEYYDEKRGIFIIYDDNENQVIHIIIRPSKEVKMKYYCNQQDKN
jgi:hypothetical protein